MHAVVIDQETRSTLYDLYRAWCRDQGLDPSDDENMKRFLADVFSGDSKQ